MLKNQGKVSVNISDGEGGVKTVTLYYSLNGSQSRTAELETDKTTSCRYYAIIPGQGEGTCMGFQIVAYDKVKNDVTEGGTEFSAYTVCSDLSSMILSVFIIRTVHANVYVKERALVHKWGAINDYKKA